jgi:tyrosine-protein phosphatase SIW14
MSFLGRGFISLLVLSLPAFAGSSVQGVKNFYQVNNHVYRGAQPTDEGFNYLAKIGVKTVVNLREHDERSLAEEHVVTADGMQYVNVPMTGLTPPTEAQITKILALLEDDTTGPVFVHCQRGADRTGAVIAAYRVDHDHWDNARALTEAKSRGMSFFQFPREHYILTFQPRTLEAKAVVKSVEATVPTTAAPAGDTPPIGAMAAAPADAVGNPTSTGARPVGLGSQPPPPTTPSEAGVRPSQ